MAGEPRSARNKLEELLFVFLPEHAKTLWKTGLWKTFAVVCLTVFVVPPAVVLFAALWLQFLKGSTIPGVRELVTAYLDVVARGFSIEEVAARNNDRLDYLQAFDYELSAQAPSRRLPISIKLRQKSEIHISSVGFVAQSADCTLPEDEGVRLLTLSLGDREVREIRKEDTSRVINVGQVWWDEHGKKFEERYDEVILFRLADDIKNRGCVRVHVAGSVLVYKDIVPTGGA